MIDVLLPVKNGMPYLGEAIQSILAQSVAEWRLIVLDHGSTDGSTELVKDFSKRDNRIQHYDCGHLSDLSSLLNYGLELSTADYVFRQDADDISLPERFAISLEALRDNPGLAVIGGNMVIINAAGEVTGSTSLPVSAAAVSAAALFSNPIAHPTVAIRMDIFRKKGASYGKAFLTEGFSEFYVGGLAEDYLLFGQLAIAGLCGNVPETVVKYRRHDNTVGSTKLSQQLLTSCNISRLLMSQICFNERLLYADPVPLCSHGNRFYCNGNILSSKLDIPLLKNTLMTYFHESEFIKRELAFRSLLCAHSHVSFFWQAFQFSRIYHFSSNERGLIKERIIGRFRGRERIYVPCAKFDI